MENEEKKPEEKLPESPKMDFCHCSDLRVIIISFLTAVIVVAGYHTGRLYLRRYLRSKQPQRTFRSCECGRFRRGKFKPGKPGGPRHGKFKPGRNFMPPPPPQGCPGQQMYPPPQGCPAPECAPQAPAKPAAPAAPKAPAKPAPQAPAKPAAAPAAAK